MKQPKTPWSRALRRVVSVTADGGFVLECGHVKRVPSFKQPHSARTVCRECDPSIPFAWPRGKKTPPVPSADSDDAEVRGTRR